MKTFFKIVKNISLLFIFVGLLAIIVGGVAVLGVYHHIAATLPRVDRLEDYRPPVITTIYAADGTPMMEYIKERRVVLPVTSMPKQLINAFVAAEDKRFFHHKGINLYSIARAALKNYRTKGIRQGGSTITQQVAKSLLLTPERTYTRKLKEALLAWRIERSLSKEGILYLYLNQIYLGHTAYGVEAAAQVYFDKSVNQLTLGECALLAGLPQAPSRYSPHHNLESALRRRRYVLSRMAEDGYISEREADEAAKEPVKLRSRSLKLDNPAPYFCEQVRRYLQRTYGEQMLYEGGLKVFTTLDPKLQKAAQEAVRGNLESYDRRHGYRGPAKILADAEVAGFLRKQNEEWDELPPSDGTLLDAVVSGSPADGKGLVVRFGSFQAVLPERSWAGALHFAKSGPFRKGNGLLFPRNALVKIRLGKRLNDGTYSAVLGQSPKAQSCLVAMDPENGRVRAMVGGYDYNESQFNRTTQAKRQPGSAFKPIVYAAALDKGYTAASILQDTPISFPAMDRHGRLRRWTPKNSGGRYHGPTSLRRALTYSYNVPVIQVLQDIGVDYAASYAAKLGIESPVVRNLTMALGTSLVTPLELTTAYCVFANGGIRVTPTYVVKILDRNGKVLESSDPADFQNGIEMGQRLNTVMRERVLSPETAYLMTNLMESVVRDGTGSRARELKRPVAGKTGTTNDLKDAWFAGFVPQLAAACWVGYDDSKPLGAAETGAKLALPGWLAFMQEALKDVPPRHFAVPDTIEFQAIDPASGLLASDRVASPFIEVFAPGTVPERSAYTYRPSASKRSSSSSSSSKKSSEGLKSSDFFKLDLMD
ncbi:MAG: PBP1A family penicillin-binding protein [Deltaproteobacteria bacterium]|nr:PBP1A family penicillin-binding protein [Deltaproteobacteria bacterium]MBR5704688.1 PBP1A family penicillin-binding protein [Deltaproteobacteria bacterium]